MKTQKKTIEINNFLSSVGDYCHQLSGLMGGLRNIQQTKASPRLTNDLMRLVCPLTVQLLATTTHVSWGTAHPPLSHWVPIWEVANMLSPHILSHFHSQHPVSLTFHLQKRKDVEE